jgi:uncharacterized membrane protein YobD (UPF0266 family)
MQVWDEVQIGPVREHIELKARGRLDEQVFIILFTYLIFTMHVSAL